MTCNNCGNKASMRHNPTVIVKGGDVDAPKIVKPETVQAGKSFTPDHNIPDMAPNPQEAFIQAKSLSFEDIMKRQGDQQKRVKLEIESAYKEMTNAMRHFHIVNLLSVANYENGGPQGISPDQAIVALKESLEREDFNDINTMYPTLRSQVLKRYDMLMLNKIIL